MAGEGTHPRDSIQDLVDGRLAPERRAEVASHFADCESCRREVDAMSSLKRALGDGLPGLEWPAGLEDELSAALDQERPASLPRRRLVQALRATAAVAAIVLVAVWLARSPEGPGDLAVTLASDFGSISGARVTLDLAVADPVVLEGMFAARGVPFPTHVYDLAMMEFRLEGGRVHQVDGRPSALFAYRNAAGAWLVCQMFPGTSSELPAGARRVETNEFEFHVFRRDRVTVVVWAEGTILCALSSDLPEGAVLDMAIAKAMKT